MSLLATSEVLKKARERGFTHIIGATSGGKMTDDIELIKARVQRLTLK
ncbi:MAG: hypothetical protein IJP86_06810 [Synergistaceae bacterium]|nr:hypothetical protein [Synergistaceae bacterium]